MYIDKTYAGITVDSHKSVHFTMQDGREVRLSSKGSIEKRTFVTLVPEVVSDLEEPFLHEYCKTNSLRLTTGFELAMLKEALWGNQPEPAALVYGIGQSIALGDTDEITGEHWFVAGSFWDFGISLMEKPELHFKIVAVLCEP
jgi:hypothetical protein